MPTSSSAWFPASAGSWMTYEEAREHSCGSVEWWKCKSVEGNRVEMRQHRSDGPEDRPIWSSDDGKMYLGGWVKHETKDEYHWHGFGVYCRRDGRLFIGTWDQGKLEGLAMRLWLPASTHWIRNNRGSSVIVSQPAEDKPSFGLPFIYVGNFTSNWKNDPKAIVILKDGTTRIGPWKRK